ncbi:MAG: hypothetical protein WC758_03780 [Candidatus Woesearchaeota archaeon]|jgi:hypothetical protein
MSTLNFKSYEPKIIMLFDELEQSFLFGHISDALFDKRTNYKDFIKVHNNISKPFFEFIHETLQPELYDLRVSPFLFFQEQISDKKYQAIQRDLKEFLINDEWAHRKLDENKIFTEIKNPYTNNTFLDHLISRLYGAHSSYEHHHEEAENAKMLLVKYGSNPNTVRILADKVMNTRTDSGMDSFDD